MANPLAKQFFSLVSSECPQGFRRQLLRWSMKSVFPIPTTPVIPDTGDARITSLLFPPVAFPTFHGTIEISDYLRPVCCTPFIDSYTIPLHLKMGNAGSPSVVTMSLYSMWHSNTVVLCRVLP